MRIVTRVDRVRIIVLESTLAYSIVTRMFIHLLKELRAHSFNRNKDFIT